jgi:hypothetical protein
VAAVATDHEQPAARRTILAWEVRAEHRMRADVILVVIRISRIPRSLRSEKRGKMTWPFLNGPSWSATGPCTKLVRFPWSSQVRAGKAEQTYPDQK